MSFQQLLFIRRLSRHHVLLTLRQLNEEDELDRAQRAAERVMTRYRDVFRKLAEEDDRMVYVDKSPNTKDIVYDRLEDVFEMQYALDQRIIEERGIQKSTSEWVLGITVAMEDEISEIRKEINWKWWKNEKEIDQAALQEEVIDLWHFLISLSQKVGLTPQAVYDVYLKKNAENHARQSGTSMKEGYAVKEDK